MKKLMVLGVLFSFGVQAGSHSRLSKLAPTKESLDQVDQRVSDNKTDWLRQDIESRNWKRGIKHSYRQVSKDEGTFHAREHEEENRFRK